MMPRPIEQWHQVVKSRDAAALKELLADDVVFVSPVVHTPQAGRTITLAYLQAAMKVLNNPSFHYLNQWFGTGVGGAGVRVRRRRHHDQRHRHDPLEWRRPDRPLQGHGAAAEGGEQAARDDGPRAAARRVAAIARQGARGLRRRRRRRRGDTDGQTRRRPHRAARPGADHQPRPAGGPQRRRRAHRRRCAPTLRAPSRPITARAWRCSLAPAARSAPAPI